MGKIYLGDINVIFIWIKVIIGKYEFNFPDVES